MFVRNFRASATSACGAGCAKSRTDKREMRTTTLRERLAADLTPIVAGDMVAPRSFIRSRSSVQLLAQHFKRETQPTLASAQNATNTGFHPRRAMQRSDSKRH